MRSFVVDGNFTADHIKQTRPDDDVWLTDGEGFMTATGPYAVHIKKAVDPKQVVFDINADQHILNHPVRQIPVNRWTVDFGQF
jgi:hypothetical protein